MNKLIYLIATLSFCTSFAAEETNREIVQTYVNFYLSQKQYDFAIERLRNHLVDDSKDSERWNTLGLILTSQKRYAEADQAYRKAVETSQDESRGIYLYNRANSANKQKKTTEALSLLEDAKKYYSVESSAVDAIEAFKPGADLPPLRLEKKLKWSGSAGLQAGYDSNVLLLSPDTLQSLSTSNTASPNIVVSGQGGVHKEFAKSVTDLNLSSSYSFYTNSATTNYNALSVNLDGKWAPVPFKYSPFNWGLSGLFNLTYMNTNGSGLEFFDWMQTVSFDGAYNYSENLRTVFQIPVRYQNFVAPADETNNRAGVALGVKTTEHFRFLGQYLTGGLEFERVWTKGANYKSYALNIPITWTFSLFWRLTSVFGFKTGGVFYNESTTNRRDIIVNPTFMLGRGFANNMTGSLSYSYISNNSTVTSGSYLKHLVLLGVNYVF